MVKGKKPEPKPGPEVRVVYLNEDGREEAYRMLAKVIMSENVRS